MAERIIDRPWSEYEDQLLKDAVAKHGEHDNWENIALCIPGRSKKACRMRWLHSLSPAVKKTAWTPDEEITEATGSTSYREVLDPNLEKDEWTVEEDNKLLEVFGRIGEKWDQIGQEMQCSGLRCRDRLLLLERKMVITSRENEQVATARGSSDGGQLLDFRSSDPSSSHISQPGSLSHHESEQPSALQNIATDSTQVGPTGSQLSMQGRSSSGHLQSKRERAESASASGSSLMSSILQRKYPVVMSSSSTSFDHKSPESENEHGHNRRYEVLQWIQHDVIQGVEFDSLERDPAPRCHPGTRTSMIQNAIEWMDNPKRDKRLIWLHGPAGVGKSAIIQTLAEALSLSQQLGATTFLSRVNGHSDPRKLFPTLAYQLALMDTLYATYLAELIDGDPRPLHLKAMEDQFRLLFVEPLTRRNLWKGRKDLLIAIDGLEDCDGLKFSHDFANKSHQQGHTNETVCRRAVKVISGFVQHYPSVPLIWIIASRSESYLQAAFLARDVKSSYIDLVVTIDADQSRKDVELFLRASFARIRQKFDDENSLLTDAQALQVANAASGLFLFAESAIRFISDESARNPSSQLSKVLAVVDHNSQPSPNPFNSLDMIYMSILSKIPEKVFQYTKRLLQLMVFIHRNKTAPFSFQEIYELLQITREDAITGLHHLHSVVSFSAPKDPPFFYHTSFPDFLENPLRSGKFAIDQLEHTDRDAPLEQLPEGATPISRLDVSTTPAIPKDSTSGSVDIPQLDDGQQHIEHDDDTTMGDLSSATAYSNEAESGRMSPVSWLDLIPEGTYFWQNLGRLSGKEQQVNEGNACIFCKSRKIACDGGRPECNQCLKRALRCVYPGPSKKKIHPKTMPTPLPISIPPFPSATKGEEDYVVRSIDNQGRNDQQHYPHIPPTPLSIAVPRSSSRSPQPVPSLTPGDRPQQRKRGKLPRETTDFLKAWLHRHSDHPYPDEEEKKQLCDATGLSMSQVSNWMINARRRILAPTHRAASSSTTAASSPSAARSSSLSGLLDPLGRRAGMPRAVDLQLYHPMTLQSTPDTAASHRHHGFSDYIPSRDHLGSLDHGVEYRYVPGQGPSHSASLTSSSHSSSDRSLLTPPSAYNDLPLSDSQQTFNQSPDPSLILSSLDPHFSQPLDPHYKAQTEAPGPAPGSDQETPQWPF